MRSATRSKSARGFSTEEWVRANPDTAKRFVAAMHETAAWANNPANHAASGAILQKYNPFPIDLLARMHRAQFDLAIVQPLLDTALEQKSIQKRILARDLLSSVAVAK